MFFRLWREDVTCFTYIIHQQGSVPAKPACAWRLFSIIIVRACPRRTCTFTFVARFIPIDPATSLCTLAGCNLAAVRQREPSFFSITTCLSPRCLIVTNVFGIMQLDKVSACVWPPPPPSYVKALTFGLYGAAKSEREPPLLYYIRGQRPYCRALRPLRARCDPTFA